MQKLILAYNFSAERMQFLKLACMMIKVPVKMVNKDDFTQPVGFLAGLPNISRIEPKETDIVLEKEMLLLCNLNRPDIDRLLSAIRKGKLQQVSLKAVLTPYNANWTGLELYKELSQEHEYMHNKKSEKPQHFSQNR